MTIDEWDKNGLTKDTLNKLFHYSKDRQFKNAFDKHFKTYRSFPPHSKFKFPKHITPDAKWASMHIGNLRCVIGHMVENTLFIVFLDYNHHFYPPKKD